MRKVLFILSFICAVSISQAQVTKGNTVSSKEIPPVWPGCETESSTSNCFNKMLATHIQKNFKFPKDYTAADKGTKVLVSFIVNKKGEIEITQVKGGRNSLQEEAKRNILAIPKMQPGSLNGKPREIKYTVPFNF
ncbi:energy transducer TonB [Mesonia aestuariivivens]|uniref:Energy transducer TonB n=1 Tax=Mesonia aestuariivivens TaxID=2796128 RepID=A0ABS6W3S0_9FLAO|nr:energy transducer TonB [Mesonia aestuariivivens]MBW2962141.1 energy transducer TonB [Mesonia aestuariivivens]